MRWSPASEANPLSCRSKSAASKQTNKKKKRQTACETSNKQTFTLDRDTERHTETQAQARTYTHTHTHTPTHTYTYLHKHLDRWTVSPADLPASAHEIPQLFRARRGLGQPHALLHIWNHLSKVANVPVRLLLAPHQHLPKRHRQCPHVARSRKLAIKRLYANTHTHTHTRGRKNGM